MSLSLAGCGFLVEKGVWCVDISVASGELSVARTVSLRALQRFHVPGVT